MAIRGMILSHTIGKYFMIKNKASGEMLNVKEGLTDPGTPVTQWKKNGAANQIFFYDPLTGTIRGKQSQLCLEMNESNRLIINDYEEGKASQQWQYNMSKSVIENSRNTVMVMEAMGKHSGADIAMHELVLKSATQIWTLVPMPVEYFVIRSNLSKKVLDIFGAKSSAGAKIQLYEMSGKPGDNQLWFEDYMGNIRSKLSDKLVLDGSQRIFYTGEYKDGKVKSHWVIYGNKIANKENLNEVITVKDAMTVDGAEMCVAEYDGSPGQHWDVEYI